MRKWQNHKETSHRRGPRGQPFPNRWPQGMQETVHYNKDTWNIDNTKRSTNEAAPWNGQSRNSLECLTCLTVPTSPLIQKWIKTHRCLVQMKDLLFIDASSPSSYKPRYKNGDKRVQQYLQLNTGAKTNPQLNHGGPDQWQNIRPNPSHLQISL